MFDANHGSRTDARAFAARWHGAPPGFVAWGHGLAADGEPPANSDAARSDDDLWRSGFDAGRAEAEADWAHEAAAMDALLVALDRLAPVPAPALADRLEQEVRALLRQLVGTASIDEALLMERCASLAELAGSDAGAALYANPADAAILAAMPQSLVIMPDDRLPRGELLLVDGAGEAATGPYTVLTDWAAQAGGETC
jgi:hypothetical protein